jgi:molybdate transport repressor ModE-like protein
MTRSLDRLTLLETFCRIAERGSISAAARDLGLSQASASRQLKDLETRLGADLIRRTTHNLALTSAGQALLADARDLLGGWEALAARQQPPGGQIAGRLSVVAPVALGQRALADIALKFQTQHPEIMLKWQLTDEPINFTETGCDCWIKVGPIPDDTLVVRRLGQVERLVVADPGILPHGRATDAAMIKDLPFIALAPFEGQQIRLTSSAGDIQEFDANVRFATNNIFAVHRAVLAGLGAAILPRWFVADDLSKGRLVDAAPGWRAASLTVHVGFSPSRHRPKRLDVFLDAIVKGMRDLSGVEPISD